MLGSNRSVGAGKKAATLSSGSSSGSLRPYHPFFTLADSFDNSDDDTWWSDISLVRSLLSGYNPAEDWLLGSFSEATQNLADNGRISYGGAGIIVSRALVRKMQPMGELAFWQEREY